MAPHGQEAGIVTPEMRATQTQALHDALDALFALGLEDTPLARSLPNRYGVEP